MHATTRVRTAIVTLLLAATATPMVGPLQAQAADEQALAIKVDDASLRWAECPPLFPAGCRIAVLHGDPGKLGADVFFQVPGGYAIPAHWHTSPERMVLVNCATVDGTATAVALRRRSQDRS